MNCPNCGSIRGFFVNKNNYIKEYDCLAVDYDEEKDHLILAVCTECGYTHILERIKKEDY